ncbi:MAG: hypothetical protein QOG71_1201 [Pyrinomonadaceae bacterium]|nr:hypothetical protein [Pyrinomonadaceae bacterium]
MGRFFRDNGLTVVMLALFLVALLGQSITGFHEYNQDQQEHGQPTVGYAEYHTTGHFVEAVFENWESEFLQMAAYVILTAYLFQRGSAESKDPDKAAPQDEDPAAAKNKKDAPWPVRRGGLALKLYQNSLFAVLFLLFLMSFALHAAGGAKEYNEDQKAHGAPVVSTVEYVGTSRFWFESFQNWQSEFLSVAAIVLLSIWLRQHGSPESKPVAAPHSQTGND